jgi:hypothetical protein
VVVVSFEQDGEAYEALTSLEELGSQGQVELRAGPAADPLGEHPGHGLGEGGIGLFHRRSRRKA